MASICVSAGAATWSATVQVDVRGPDEKPVSGAVVFLESAAAQKAVRPMPDAEVVQKKKQFLPEVLLVTTGTEIRFPNHDAVRHHVYSFSPAKKFELKLYKGTPSNPVLFDQPGVVVLGCNIHDAMVGWILVVDTPYMAQTDATGIAAFSGVPAGNYHLRTWHKNLAAGATPQDQSLVVGTGNALTKADVRLSGLLP